MPHCGDSSVSTDPTPLSSCLFVCMTKPWQKCDRDGLREWTATDNVSLNVRQERSLWMWTTFLTRSTHFVVSFEMATFLNIFFLLFTYYFSFMNFSPFFFSIFSLEIFRQNFNSASVRLWSGLKCVGAQMSKFGIVIVTQRWKLFRTHVFVALSPFGKQTEF